MSDFGDYLKNLREKRGFGVNQLGTKSGVSSSLISKIENGHRGRPKAETIQKLALALKVPFEEMMKQADSLPEEEENDSAEKLIDYLEMELTNDEIKERMTFKVDDITLSSDEVDEFVNWVRVNRAMKISRTATVSKSEGP